MVTGEIDFFAFHHAASPLTAPVLKPAAHRRVRSKTQENAPHPKGESGAAELELVAN